MYCFHPIVTDTPMVGSIMLFSLIGKFAVSTAFALLYVYTSELFPTEARNKGMGISSVLARIGGMLAPFVSLLVRGSDNVLVCVTHTTVSKY